MQGSTITENVNELREILKNLGIEIPPVPVSAIIALTGMTQARLSHLNRDGILRKLAKGKYDLLDCAVRFNRYEQSLAAGKGYTDEKGSSRIELDRARAMKARIEAEKAQGSVIPIADAQLAFNVFAARIVMILESWPGRIANTCAHQDPGVIRQRAKDEVRGIRVAISDTARELASLGNPTKSRKPTTPKTTRPSRKSRR